MRKRFELQLELGAKAIEDIEMPIKSRDELPSVLLALQHIYLTPELNEQVFDLLEEKIPIYNNGVKSKMLCTLFFLLYRPDEA